MSAAACADSTGSHPSVPATTPNAATASDISRADVVLKSVARAVAVALQEASVRSAVRDALRDSPWDVHQISLQQYLGSAAGRTLLEAAARAAGESPDAFRARVAALPDLDFYMPDREQRRSWRATAGVVVAAGIDIEGGSAYGFGPDGQAIPNVLKAERPLLLIHPAEERGRRNEPQRAGVGDVIQSATDGERALRYRWISPEGKVTEVDINAVREGRDPNFTMEMNGNDSTYLDHLAINFTDPGDDAEMSVYAKFYAPDGTYLGQVQYDDYSLRWTGSGSYPHAPLFRQVMPDQSAARIEVRAREDDGWGNPDDHFGPRNYTWADRGLDRTIQNVDPNGSLVTVALGWVQRSPSVFTSVAVDAAYPYVGDSYYVGASAVDQYGYRIPGYSVSAWSTANSNVATVTPQNGSTALVYGVGAGSTTLFATINGVTGSAPVYVEYPPVECNPHGTEICME